MNRYTSNSDMDDYGRSEDLTAVAKAMRPLDEQNPDGGEWPDMPVRFDEASRNAPPTGPTVVDDDLRLPGWPARSVFTCWVAAVCLWCGLGISLGWYYTFTYYGRSGWPMPTPDSCAALILYYFSVVNAATEVQAVHWVSLFPLAGILWVFSLWILAPRFGDRWPEFHWVLLLFSLANLPLTAAAPWMAYVAGGTETGFVWRRMIDVALRRGSVSPWSWLTPLYVALAVAALFLQIKVYRDVFRIRGRRAWYHFAASAILLTVLACGTGTLLSIPLRLWLE